MKLRRFRPLAPPDLPSPTPPALCRPIVSLLDRATSPGSGASLKWNCRNSNATKGIDNQRLAGSACIYQPCGTDTISCVRSCTVFEQRFHDAEMRFRVSQCYVKMGKPRDARGLQPRPPNAGEILAPWAATA